jgi:hypothetical protein
MLGDQQGTGVPPSQLAETHLDNRLVVDLAVLVHRTGVELENLGSHLFIQEWHLDFAVEPAGAHQCGIKRVWSVSCQDETLCARESKVSIWSNNCAYMRQLVGRHCMALAGCRMALRSSINVRWWPRVYPNISCTTRADSPMYLSMIVEKTNSGTWFRAPSQLHTRPASCRSLLGRRAHTLREPDANGPGEFRVDEGELDDLRECGVRHA